MRKIPKFKKLDILNKWVYYIVVENCEKDSSFDFSFKRMRVTAVSLLKRNFSETAFERRG